MEVVASVTTSRLFVVGAALAAVLAYLAAGPMRVLIPPVVPAEPFGSRVELQDYFVTPGGPIWLLFRGAERLVCRVEPQSDDARCAMLAPAVARHTRAFLSRGSEHPVVTVIDESEACSPTRAIALDPFTGLPAGGSTDRFSRPPVVLNKADVPVLPTHGEGAYFDAPRPFRSDVIAGELLEARAGWRTQSICITPDGHVRTIWPPNNPFGDPGAPTAPWGRDDHAIRDEMKVSVEFWLNARKVAAVEHLPSAKMDRVSISTEMPPRPPRYFCGEEHAVLIYYDRDDRVLGELDVTPNGALERFASLEGVHPQKLDVVSFGEKTLVVWQSRSGAIEMRLAPLEQLSRAPTRSVLRPRVDADGSTTAQRDKTLLDGAIEWESTITIGRAALLVLQEKDTMIARIDSEGRVSWLRRGVLEPPTEGASGPAAGPATRDKTRAIRPLRTLPAWSNGDGQRCARDEDCVVSCRVDGDCCPTACCSTARSETLEQALVAQQLKCCAGVVCPSQQCDQPASHLVARCRDLQCTKEAVDAR